MVREYALLIVAFSAVVAVPAWLLMRAINAYSGRVRAKRDAQESAEWDAEVEKIRREAKNEGR